MTQTVSVVMLALLLSTACSGSAPVLPTPVVDAVEVVAPPPAPPVPEEEVAALLELVVVPSNAASKS